MRKNTKLVDICIIIVLVLIAAAIALAFVRPKGSGEAADNSQSESTKADEIANNEVDVTQYNGNASES